MREYLEWTFVSKVESRARCWIKGVVRREEYTSACRAVQSGRARTPRGHGPSIFKKRGGEKKKS